MKKQAGSRIPSFTKEQSELIRGSADFIGINHYKSLYVSDGSNRKKAGLRDYNADMAAHFRVSRNDTPSDKYAPSKILSDPKGLQCFGQFDKEDSLNDTERVEYLSSYMGGTLAALRNGANVKGYFVWSFLDMFELFAGYHSPFGLHHVDFEDPSLPRQPKLSAQWYSKFLRSEIGINIENMISPHEHEHSYYQ
uniref:4-hydroxy-7-methoxy-3-oxo-3,4-dihydro-2H-1,4-benzoxazin-2-yl glucosidebeta-D-glucosidase n=1 Tax=Oryza meridionalis TaxID=40149 RepID=A0A0E0F0I8_9ORYZ